MEKRHIILIGMPGSGKSTVGVVLAKYLGYDFLDSDIQIQKETGRTLPELIRQYGPEGFLDVEGHVNAALDPPQPTVIATGGSVIYREAAMEHLRAVGTLVYLRLSCPALEARVHDLEARGVVIADGVSFAELYAQRIPLYEKYAEITLDTEEISLQECAARLVSLFRK